MNIVLKRMALAAALSLAALPGIASAFPDCPADSGIDGYTCTELKGVGKKGGYFRVTIPSNWDGDLVVVNHGFDLSDRKLRPHETCSNNANQACAADVDCGMGNFCNNISYLGLDEVLLPMGKAVAANTYSQSGWAVFGSAKDLKEMIKFVDKHETYGDQLKRVLVTGFSLGGAVTVDAILKLKIDGAVPLCAAAGGGLPTWDVAQEVRLVYDFLCDDVPGAKFQSLPDQGEENSLNTSGDSTTMALTVDACFGVIGFAPDDGFQAQRLADFLTLTGFSGYQGPSAGINVATAMGFATLGLGDFVRDENRLKGARIGFNDTLDYTGLGGDMTLAAAYNADVKRLTFGKGRKKLAKYSNPTFLKGKGKSVEYPILSMPNSGDWLVIPEFQRVFTDALVAGSKSYTQVWNANFGHCVFSEEEVTAVFNKFFEWLGPDGGPYGAQPTAADVKAECLALGGIDGDTCHFDLGYVADPIYDRIPHRSDWPAAAMP